MKISETTVQVEWEKNDAAEEFKDLCKDNPLRIQMSMYGGFEQVGAIGGENPVGQYFTGQSYLSTVSAQQVTVFHVTFEPACRNNWHIHHAKKGGGQILIGVGGKGWYQEEGKEAQVIEPGTVINIPANVKHWHGAAKDNWFSHLAIEADGEEMSNEWLEPVTDEVYSKL